MELFPSPYQALFEITLGLQQIFTTRKVCLFQRGFHPYAEEIALRFARLGFRIEWIERDGANLTALREKSREVLFVLYSEDHPFTGEHLSAEALDRFLKFPAYSLGLSFAAHRRPKLWTTPLPLQGFIYVLADGRTVATLGQRFKISLTLSAHLLTLCLDLSEWQNARSYINESRVLVEEFEQFAQTQLAAQSFAFKGPRIYDRSVLRFPRVDSTAIREHLVEKDSKYEDILPFGLNFHRSEKSVKWMLQAGHTLESLQGLVAIPLPLLTAEFKEELRESVQRVAQLQDLNF